MFTNSWKVNDLLDVILLQNFTGSDSRSFQNRRGSKGSGGNDDEARCPSYRWFLFSFGSSNLITHVLYPDCLVSPAKHRRNWYYVLKSNLLKDDANNSLSVQDRQILVFILGVDVVMRYIGTSTGLSVDVPRQVLYELKKVLRQVSCLPWPSLQ